MSEGLASLSELIGASLVTGFKGFGKNALGILGQFAKTVGQIIMGLGIAALPIVSGSFLSSPQGAIAAIAGGAALIALGSALGAVAKAGPGGASGGGGYVGSYSGSSGGYANVKLQAVLRGSDIWLSNTRYQDSLSRNT
jgi:hypothetical protein